MPFFVRTNCTDLSRRALVSVTGTPDREPTGNNSTDVLIGLGFWACGALVAADRRICAR
jgi:hypothetical protein